MQKSIRSRLTGTFAGTSLHRAKVRLTPAYQEMQRRGFPAYFAGYPREAIKAEWDDLWGIYSYTVERRPRVVVEIGGGLSTFVFAHAAAELAADGHGMIVHSIDQSDYWQEVVRSRMPERLKPFVSFHRATAVALELEGRHASRLDALPVSSCNLVYVDGGNAAHGSIGTDALILEREAPPDYAILVDGRDNTVAGLEKFLTNKYRVERDRFGRRQTMFIRSPE
jgi:hypothetical protein